MTLKTDPFKNKHTLKEVPRTSLVAQWLKNLPAIAGDIGSILGLGRFHVPQFLKPVHLRSVLCNKRRHCNEKPA